MRFNKPIPSYSYYNKFQTGMGEKKESISITKIKIPKPIRQLAINKPSTAENSIPKNQVSHTHSFNFNTALFQDRPVDLEVKQEDDPQAMEFKRNFKKISIFVPEDGYSKVSVQKKHANQELANLYRVHKMLIRVFHNEKINDLYYDLQPYEIKIILEFIMRKDKTVIWDR